MSNASHISAGLPSPANDCIEAEPDLNRLMARGSLDTFMPGVNEGSLSGAEAIRRGSPISSEDVSAALDKYASDLASY